MTIFGDINEDEHISEFTDKNLLETFHEILGNFN